MGRHQNGPRKRSVVDARTRISLLATPPILQELMAPHIVASPLPEAPKRKRDSANKTSEEERPTVVLNELLDGKIDNYRELNTKFTEAEKRTIILNLAIALGLKKE